MAIRIECPHSDWKGVYIEFKSSGWTFGARRKITEATSDVVVLELILEFIESWHMLDVGGKEVKFELEKGIELLDDLDDRVIVPWIIGAWFEARNERTDLPKNS